MVVDLFLEDLPGPPNQARGRRRFPPEIEDTLEELITTLELFSPLREHIKTMYFQWELVDLSRRVIYAAVPALTIVYAVPFYVDATTFPGATLGIDNLVWLVSAGITIGTIPFFVLLSYVLRIATIAKRTLAIGPTVLRTSEDLRPD
ncbi:hypothetical protein [Haloarcula nitratireducens]|uniref:Uncharacterized protein n=1 Tax=Haloarcula nitratireducens TaxID=2487749 RepID=A0AAW4PA33_9EURY|nr:hypothetical protein [Halomicroarcula nitratireducens]MBX0294618.1 hypothetical protein [Halomicroarcula nitratireducens]